MENSTASIRLVDASCLADTQLKVFLAWLSPSETQRYGRFLRRQRQRQFLIGRVLLRQALGDILGVPASMVCLADRPGAAPHLVLPEHAGGAPGFSLSHSGDWVACAVSADTSLGLDIEVVNPARDFSALSLQAFDAGQVAALDRLPGPARLAGFYRLWCEQEARYKLGACAAPSCIALAHASLSIVLCSARPLAAVPAITLSTLWD